ncbi:hypothetical protein PAL_GLEAN10006393 [Pteropus alecto]|uniref:Uncharacterized protein n=1 Tax=Pteropus alecto TaxID=9402 RepID=L5KSD5_PTEAL|nr:hypothetical protein PAL_GLEAN10006393 [Pteropus alecto]
MPESQVQGSGAGTASLEGGGKLTGPVPTLRSSLRVTSDPFKEEKRGRGPSRSLTCATRGEAADGAQDKRPDQRHALRPACSDTAGSTQGAGWGWKELPLAERKPGGVAWAER